MQYRVFVTVSDGSSTTL